VPEEEKKFSEKSTDHVLERRVGGGDLESLSLKNSLQKKWGDQKGAHSKKRTWSVSITEKKKKKKKIKKKPTFGKD